MKCLFGHKFKWSEIKTEHLLETYMGIMYPKDIRGKSIQVSYWYQDGYCQRCNKYFYREIKK